MDRTDELICEMIRENARISYKELGDAIRMSRVAAKKRVQKLEREGVIRGYHACIYLKDEVTMLIDIETAPGKMENVIRVLTNRMAYIREIFKTTSGNHVHIVAVSEDSANLGYLIKMIKKNCGNDIVSIDSRIVKEVIKDN
ncbi:MAG: Lrp/AsnC family transcriptional regulator [Lachnospiraceae bacterium]|nr:Lrp/AsnC family transcriptional regulator [Lachnospiraceae bacterium]